MVPGQEEGTFLKSGTGKIKGLGLFRLMIFFSCTFASYRIYKHTAEKGIIVKIESLLCWPTKNAARQEIAEKTMLSENNGKVLFLSKERD